MLDPANILPLIQNLGLMAVLAIAYAALARRLDGKDPRLASVIYGVMFGIAGSMAMLIPVELTTGLIFDVRGVPLTLSAAFGGPWAAVVAAVVIGGTRTLIGGAGVPPALIAAALMAGLSIGLWYLRQRSEQRPRRFYPRYFAVAGALAILPVYGGLLFLGFDTANAIMAKIGLALFFSVALGCYIVGLSLIHI